MKSDKQYTENCLLIKRF